MDSEAQLIASLSRLPIEVITMIGLRLKDQGEHLLLANLATIPGIGEGITKVYTGRLFLDKASTRSIVRALPHVSIAIRRSLLNGAKGDWGEISVPKREIARMKGLLWPNVPCPSDSESEETGQSGRKKGNGDRRRDVGERMMNLLGEVDRLSITELPRATDCAALLAIAKSRLRASLLCAEVSAFSLGPGVYDTMLDWKDRHDGETHPLLAFCLAACYIINICIDYSRVITKEIYITNRLGIDLIHSSPEQQTRRRERLARLWQYFDNYGRYGVRLFGSGVENTPRTITIHNADLGLCYGYKNTQYRLFYNRLSTTVTDENPGRIPRIRQLTYLLRQTHQKLNNEAPLFALYDVVLPSVDQDDNDKASDEDASDDVLASKMRKGLYEIMEGYSYSKKKEDLDVLRDTCDNVSLVAVEKAYPCMCCWRK